MRVAVAGCPPGEVPALLERLAAAGVTLLVLPEHGTGDPAAAVPSDGPLARRLAALARDTGVALLAGYPERCVTGTYNAAMLFDRRGICLLNYRQSHLRAADRATWRRGQWLSLTPLEGRRLGVLIGYDIEFPEPARALALAGCELLAVLGGATDCGAAAVEIVLPARARDNGCWLAYASPGLCALVGSDGRVRACGGEPQIVDLDAPAHPPGERPPWLADRRPRLYEELTRPEDEEGRPA